MGQVEKYRILSGTEFRNSLPVFRHISQNSSFLFKWEYVIAEDFFVKNKIFFALVGTGDLNPEEPAVRDGSENVRDGIFRILVYLLTAACMESNEIIIHHLEEDNCFLDYSNYSFCGIF